MIKNLLSDDEPKPDMDDIQPGGTPSGQGVFLKLFDEDPPANAAASPAEASADQSISAAETIRRSGMAWSAGVAFFGAVVFMLILGWGADLLLGTSPWGIVAGIVIGSIIGFVQFFRITSQIFKK